MKRAPVKISLTLSLTFLLLSQNALAGGVFNGGGGGDATLLDILSVRQELYKNCDKWSLSSLKEAGITCGALKEKMDEVGTDEQRFRIDEKVIRNGKEYDGWNRCATPEDSDITFSRTRWKKSPDIFAKFGIVAHEFFGCMGLEPTGNYKVSGPFTMELRKKLGPSFKVEPNSVTMDIVGFRDNHALDAQGRRRMFFKVELLDEVNNLARGEYHYISTRNESAKTVYLSRADLRELTEEFQRASKSCPVRITVSYDSGKIVAKQRLCGREVDAPNDEAPADSVEHGSSSAE